MHYLDHYERDVPLTGWTNTQVPLKHLADRSKVTGYENVTLTNVLRGNVIYLLDEAQSSYEVS